MNKIFVLSTTTALSRRLTALGVTMVLAVTPLLLTFPSQAYAETIDPSNESTTMTDTAIDQSTQQTQPTSSENSIASDPIVPAQNPPQVTPEPTSDASTVSAQQQNTPTDNPPVSSDPSTILDTSLNVDAQNTVESVATSGNVEVLDNRAVGDAASGNATASSTTINLIQSNISNEGSTNGPVLFSYDVDGTVNGNLLIDTNDLLGNPSSSPLALSSPESIPILLIDNTNVSIINTIGLSALSGDVTALNNGALGSVSTGDAYAVANIINLINSGVSSGQSFIGVINIHGSLNGDIILPNGLLANSSTPQDAPLLTATTDQSFTILNIVTNQAISGDITASKNGALGNMTTGDAQNNTSTTNIIGSNTSADNYILVFVNVLGTWRGMLLQLPAGQTSYTPILATSASPASSENNGQSTVQSDTTISLVNDVSVYAQSGDIALTDNRVAGNIKTGNATTKVNILNIANSHVNLRGWFGILLINVFGNWTGSLIEEPKQITINEPAGPTTAVLGIVITSSDTTTQPTSVRKSTKRYISTNNPNQYTMTSSASTIVDIDDVSTPASASTLLVERKGFPSDENSNSWAIVALIAGVTTATGAVVGTRYYLNR